MRMFTNYGIGLLVAITCGLSFIYGECALADAWYYEQDFEALNAGGLGGQDSWTTVTSDMTVGSVQYYTPDQSAKGTSQFSVYRDISAVDSGTYYYAIYVDTLPPSGDGINVRNVTSGGAYCNALKVTGSGELQYYSSGSYTKLEDITTDEWHIIGTQLDLVNQQVKYKYDDKDWTAWVPTGGVCTEATRMKIDADSGDYYIDDFSLTVPSTSTEETPSWEDTTSTSALLTSIKKSTQEIVFAFAILIFVLVGYGAYKLSGRLERL